MAARSKKPASKSTARKKSTTKKAAQGYRTLRVAKPDKPFLSFKVTKQTVYWTILVAFIIVMQIWILNVQFNVVQATDQLNQQIEQNN